MHELQHIDVVVNAEDSSHPASQAELSRTCGAYSSRQPGECNSYTTLGWSMTAGICDEYREARSSALPGRMSPNQGKAPGWIPREVRGTCIAPLLPRKTSIHEESEQ